MKLLLLLSAALFHFAIPVQAQTACGTPGLFIDVTPRIAARGEPIRVTLTNVSGPTVSFTGTCLIQSVYPGVGCTGTPVYAPSFCGPVDLVLTPGNSRSEQWNQFMNQPTAFGQAPPGVYSVTLLGSVAGVPIACCESFTVLDFEENCSGDGGNLSGCTECPCGNNASIGTVGGCLNSAGQSARLSASGLTLVPLIPDIDTDLRFELTGAVPDALCLLTSGDAVAPGNPINPCFGLNTGVQSAVQDGLRCVISNTRRHGTRRADSNGNVGATNDPWGGEGAPAAGIALAFEGFVAGQTRHFQALNRDDPTLVCMRGLNSSQSLGVTFSAP